jgi:putative DNA primase/helicase
VPVSGDSGNGANLLYRIELPNDEPSKLLVQRALIALSQKFSDTRVEIDTGVYNAARIWKVPYTLACKGDNAPELGRVHRYAQLLEIPDKIEIVSREQLEAIAALATESTPSKKQSGKAQAHKLDAVTWLTQHGVAVESQAPYQDGTKYILAECPLNPEHKRSAFVIQFASGALSAGCLHESCASLDWKTFRAMFEPQPSAPHDSEESLALEFVSKHGADSRYTASWNRWNWWTGTHWREDETLQAFSFSRTVCRDAAMAALDEPAKARRLASASTVYAVERLARCDSRVVATAEQWDQTIWLLNTPAGTVDLRTGELRAHRREDLITKILATSPGGECPLWKRFLSRITNQNPELESYLQRVAGYGSTGSTREQALFFCHGTGANGKGVFNNTMAGVLGPYSTGVPIETLMASRNSSDRHPTDLAGLRGARLVSTAEVEKGGRWAESKIKQLTGGDPITARFMRGNFFTFIPQFKLVIAGNHRPALRSVDEAIRRRFHLIPFTVTIPASERDPDLCEKLKIEYPGILSWIIQGCLAWQREGLNPPACVREATQEYFTDEDAQGSWIRECCVLGAQHMASSTALYLSCAPQSDASTFVRSRPSMS